MSEWKTVHAGPDWEPSEDLIAAAKEQPGGMVAAIAGRYLEDPSGYVPTELIEGVWVVDQDGQLTGEFRANPEYGPPPVDDFTKLTQEELLLTQLGVDPVALVRSGVTDMLDQQQAGTTVAWMKVTDPPRHLTGGTRTPDGDVTVTCLGLAVPIVFEVNATDGRRPILHAVFSHVVTGLGADEPPSNRIWLDLDETADWAEEQLQTRILDPRN